MRNALGIKANLEMFLLVDGMFRQQGKHFRILIGDPITPKELSKVGSVNEQCDFIRKKTYFLAKKD